MTPGIIIFGCDWLLSVEKASDWHRIEPSVTGNFFLGYPLLFTYILCQRKVDIRVSLAVIVWYSYLVELPACPGPGSAETWDRPPGRCCSLSGPAGTSSQSSGSGGKWTWVDFLPRNYDLSPKALSFPISGGPEIASKILINLKTKIPPPSRFQKNILPWKWEI